MLGGMVPQLDEIAFHRERPAILGDGVQHRVEIDRRQSLERVDMMHVKRLGHSDRDPMHAGGARFLAVQARHLVQPMELERLGGTEARKANAIGMSRGD